MSKNLSSLAASLRIPMPDHNDTDVTTKPLRRRGDCIEAVVATAAVIEVVRVVYVAVVVVEPHINVRNPTATSDHNDTDMDYTYHLNDGGDWDIGVVVLDIGMRRYAARETDSLTKVLLTPDYSSCLRPPRG